MSGRFFGAAVTRLEDARLLVGKGKYVDDIDLPGMLHAAFVRASFAHGRIRSIDTGDCVHSPAVGFDSTRRFAMSAKPSPSFWPITAPTPRTPLPQ